MSFNILEVIEMRVQENILLLNNSYHHELAPGPYVEIVGRHGEVPRHWRHAELHVGVGDVGLAVVKPSSLHHLLPHGRESPVTANHQVRLDRHLGLSFLGVERSERSFVWCVDYLILKD